MQAVLLNSQTDSVLSWLTKTGVISRSFLATFSKEGCFFVSELHCVAFEISL